MDLSSGYLILEDISDDRCFGHLDAKRAPAPASRWDWMSSTLSVTVAKV